MKYGDFTVSRREGTDRFGKTAVDESFDACEDGDFNIRVEKAGLRTYMSPSIAIKYYPRENLSSLYSQMLRYGQGRFKLLQKHPQTISINGLILPMLICGLILLPLLFLVNRVLGIIGIGLYLVYLLIVLWISLIISLKTLKFTLFSIGVFRSDIFLCAFKKISFRFLALASTSSLVSCPT